MSASVNTNIEESLNMVKKVDEQPIFFITGRGRSGTWLLKSILDSHEDVCVAPEALFIMHLYQKYFKVKEWDRNKLRAFFDDLIMEERLKRWWKINELRLLGKILEEPSDTTFGNLIKLVYQEYSLSQEKKENVFLGDKNPGHTLFMDKLLALYPKTKFIHMVRDPRDNILSFKKASFDLNNTAALASRWNYYNEQALKFGKAYPDRFLLIRFEDLLSDSEVTLTKICDFIGVDYRPSLLEFYKNPKNVFPWNSKVAEPLDGKAAYKWKQKMKASEVETVNYICQDLIQYFGYDYIPPQSSAFSLWSRTILQRLWGRLADFLEVFIFKLPTSLRIGILNLYRRGTGTLET